MDRTIGGDTKTTFTGANGEQYNMTTGDEVSLPDNWPSNVPIPNDAKVTYSGSVLNGQAGGGLTVVYTTSQSAADVTEYYKSELTSKGWTLQGTIATAQGSMVSASLSEKQNIVVYVSSADNETTVSITAQMSE